MSAKKKTLRIDPKPITDAIKHANELLKVAHGQIFRPLGLEAAAKHESLFPPASPSSKRRGRDAFAPDFIHTAIGILDTAETGRMNEFLKADIVAACRKGDADFFVMMAEATKHVQAMPAPLSLPSEHAKKVITLRKAAAIMFRQGKPPTKSKLRDVVGKFLRCDPTSSPAWVLAFKDAGLQDLPLRPPAKKAAKVRGKKR